MQLVQILQFLVLQDQQEVQVLRVQQGLQEPIAQYLVQQDLPALRVLQEPLVTQEQLVLREPLVLQVPQEQLAQQGQQVLLVRLVRPVQQVQVLRRCQIS